jgi:hypothetical protein
MKNSSLKSFRVGTAYSPLEQNTVKPVNTNIVV